MKKVIGVSVLSAILVLGQPLATFANTTNSGIINFEDIGPLITEQNLQVAINQNNREDSNVGAGKLRKDIRDINRRLDKINDEKHGLSMPDDASLIIALNTEKSALLDQLKTLERQLEDMPTSVDSTDTSSTMSDNTQIRTAEGAFITLNALKLASSDLSMSITNLQNQLSTMQLREKLGVVSHTEVDNLNTMLMNMQTQLVSNQLQQESNVRQLRDLLNDQDSTLQIGSVPMTDENFTVADKDADLKQALENSYTIKALDDKIVLLEDNLARAEKDNGLSSTEYKTAKYALDNANLTLAQQKNKLNTDYSSILDDIAKKQSNLQLEEQKLADKKVALSEAQIKMNLGMITQLDLDSATTDYQTQEDTVKTDQIQLFSSINSYNWFLKGMPWTS
ncbi:TolC family protein [Desulfosporosinus sp. BG]|uniref:TolC family protein n=1 Tax=Desulfosporosinus sp. BG TaxID=1633135 RepID=UPI00083AE548|nr:TolC family protein [Desulfosporosinus sp. BG]ODA41426.1 hypothetical protein DSBG_1702 [Desulfosporosinus sp. BG]